MQEPGSAPACHPDTRLFVVQLLQSDESVVAEGDGEETVELGFFEVFEEWAAEGLDEEGDGVGVGDDEGGA